MGNLVHERDVFISYIDILGFSKETFDEKNLSKIEKFLFYEHALGNTLNRVLSGGDTSTRIFHESIFSDSVFIIDDDLNSTIEASIDLYRRSLIVLNLPLIAHISQGDVFLNSDHDIWIGPGINKAAKLVEDKTIIGAGVYIDSCIEPDFIASQLRFYEGNQTAFKQVKSIEYMFSSDDAATRAHLQTKSQGNEELNIGLLETLIKSRNSLSPKGKFLEKCGSLIKEINDIPQFLSPELLSETKKR